MSAKYKFSDVFDNASFKKGFSELEKMLADVDRQIKGLSGMKSNVSGADYKKVNEAVKENIKFQKQLLQIEKDLEKEEKKLAKEKETRIKKETAEQKIAAARKKN